MNSGSKPMTLQIMASGEKGDVSGISGRAARNNRQIISLGKGYLQLAQTPKRLANSIASQRCIPLLCTMIISGVNGDVSGSATTPVSASTRLSILLLV